WCRAEASASDAFFLPAPNNVTRDRSAHLRFSRRDSFAANARFENRVELVHGRRGFDCDFSIFHFVENAVVFSQAKEPANLPGDGGLSFAGERRIRHAVSLPE